MKIFIRYSMGGLKAPKLKLKGLTKLIQNSLSLIITTVIHMSKNNQAIIVS